MSKHTPGPWSIADDGTIEANRAGLVGHLANASESDSRLIASAPDLLEGLQQVMGWIDSWSPDFTRDPEWPEYNHHIRAAIRKATGEQ